MLNIYIKNYAQLRKEQNIKPKCAFYELFFTYLLCLFSSF